MRPDGIDFLCKSYRPQADEASHINIPGMSVSQYSEYGAIFKYLIAP